MIQNSKFVDWIRDYFSKLPNEIDADVLSEYVSGVLTELDAPGNDLHSEVRTLLSAYLPDDVCETASVAIVDAFNAHHLSNTEGHNGQNGDQANGDLIKMEEHMRALMRADCARVIPDAPDPTEHRRERDACTSAWLREAGVAGYQGDSEEEKSVEIAITNAEFRAKQRLDAISGREVVEDSVPELFPTESPDSEIDLEQLEDISGYGKKDDVKPGTVEDALSVLNPSLFGATKSVATRAFPVGVTRLPTPGARPNPSMGFRLPTIISATTDSAAAVNQAAEEDDSAKGRRAERKKKAPVPSKHIAKVAAQAEAKATQAKSKNPLKDTSQGSCPPRGVARARQDEMDAFLFSDSESETEKSPAPLPEGGNNRERIAAAEKAAREKAAAAAVQRKAEEKANREKQLKQAMERKQAAQKKAQKVERRR